MRLLPRVYACLLLPVWCLLPVGAAQKNDTARPDLDVTYIERAPLYPAYCVGYNQPDLVDVPILLDAQTLQPLDRANDIKRQPAPGDRVTFTAHVRNRGSAACGEWEYQWFVDDAPAASGTYKNALKPGEEAAVTLAWNWQAGAHRIRCTVDAGYKIAQTTPKNDTLEVATNAWLLALAVDQQTYDRFNQLDNVAGTRSFEDWAQWHIAKMNELLQSRTKPSLSPLSGTYSDPHLTLSATDENDSGQDKRNGAGARVACNKIVVVPDANLPWPDLLRTEAANPLDAGYDGAWAFGHASDMAHWAANPDWGLIHEWGHQLALTDENGLDRQPGQNLVRDESGDPLAMGHVSSQAGGLMYAPGERGFSPLSLAALAAQTGTRRGYYGDHYFAMPAASLLVILDAAGKPVPNARVTAWQDDGDSIVQPVSVFSETSDMAGRILLPNRPAPHVTTPAGFTLHDNPFGQVLPNGAKAVLFLRIAARGQTDYAWLDVAELNLAYFAGNRSSVTVTRRTHIPALDAPRPPDSLRADSTDGKTTLTWDAVPAAKTYRVYRLDPRTSKWQTVGEPQDDTLCKVEAGKEGLARYAVVTISANGLESAFSNIVGVMPLFEPWGVVVLRNGRRLIRDAQQPQAIMQKPDGSFVGLSGPAELDLRGATDVAIDSKGRIISVVGRGSAAGRQGFVIQNGDLSEAKSVLAAPGSGPGQFQNPMGVAVDAQDNIFICDTDNDRIQKYDPTGKFKAIIGLGLVKQPHKLAIDKQNNLIICDTASDRLTVLRHDTDGVYRLHGHANNLSRPVSIVTDAQGRFFISCQGENAVVALNSQFYRLPWKYTGTENSRLQSPAGLSLDGKGHLLVIDAGSKRVLETRLP